MGLLDYQNPYAYAGLLGGTNDLAGIAQAYGGYRPGQPPIVEQPDDIMNPINGWANVIQGHVPLSQLLGRAADTLLPPMNGGPQASPWMPSPQIPQAIPPQPAPRFPAPQVKPQALPQAQAGPPLSILPQDVNAQAALPPKAQQTEYLQPRPPQQQPQPFMTGMRNRLQTIAGILDPSQRAQLQETGTDPFTGQKTFATFNPVTSQLAPIAMQGASSAAPQSLGAFSEAVRSGVSGDALYQHLPAEMRNTVKSMIEGRSQLPSAAAMRNPQIMALISAANAIDPTFDATEWGKRSALVKNYLSGGKQFQELQAIGTVAGHLENLAKSADAMKNTDYPFLNSVKNWWLQQTGDPRIDKLGTDIQAVSNELSKAYRGGHVTEGDVKEWNSKINAAKSPAQFKAVIGEFNDLLRSKREMIEQGYRQGMAKNPLPAEFSAESEKSRQKFENVARWANGESAASTGLAAGTYTWTPQGLSK